MTIEQAIHRNTENILRQLEPLKGLADQAQGSEPEDSPVTMILDLLRSVLTSQEALRTSIEGLHSRMDQPSLELALKTAVKA